MKMKQFILLFILPSINTVPLTPQPGAITLLSYPFQPYQPHNPLIAVNQPVPGIYQPGLSQPSNLFSSRINQNSVLNGGENAVIRLKPAPGFPVFNGGNLVPYIDTRALCSGCSCESDFGCAYNCDKCSALCLSCDCSTSIGCKYNCDKCEERNQNLDISNGSQDSQEGSQTPQNSQESQGTPGSQSSQNHASSQNPTNSEGSQSSQNPISSQGSQSSQNTISSQGSQSSQNPISSQGSQSSQNPISSQGSQSFQSPISSQGSQVSPLSPEKLDCGSLLNTEIDICLWGPSCHHIVSAHFPSCNYNCSTCKLEESAACFAESGPAAGEPCVFPFIYNGVKYNGCAPLHSEAKGLQFWCSTKTDVNRYHVRGPSDNAGKYVGFCSSSCPKSLPTFF